MFGGELYSAKSGKLMLPTGIQASAKDFDLSDEQNVKRISGQNGAILGYVTGEYKATFKMVLLMEDFLLLNEFAGQFGGFFNMPAIPIVTTYGDLSQGQKLIEYKFKAKLKKRDPKGKENDAMEVSVEGEVVSIPTMNGVPAFLPI